MTLDDGDTPLRSLSLNDGRVKALWGSTMLDHFWARNVKLYGFSGSHLLVGPARFSKYSPGLDESCDKLTQRHGFGSRLWYLDYLPLWLLNLHCLDLQQTPSLLASEAALEASLVRRVFPQFTLDELIDDFDLWNRLESRLENLFGGDCTLVPKQDLGQVDLDLG